MTNNVVLFFDIINIHDDAGKYEDDDE